MRGNGIVGGVGLGGVKGGEGVTKGRTHLTFGVFLAFFSSLMGQVLDASLQL